MNQYDEILEMFTASGRDIKIFPADKDRAEGIKEKYQISNAGCLGGIVCNTGGIVAGNVARLYGSGGFLDIGSKNEKWGEEGRFLIGEDIFGGLFAIVKGGFVSYFAPDSLEWENLETDYSGFMKWLAKGDINLFYNKYLWSSWEKDAASLKANEGFSFYPMLWSGVGEGEERSRQVVLMDEIFGLNMELLKGLNDGY